MYSFNTMVFSWHIKYAAFELTLKYQNIDFNVTGGTFAHAHTYTQSYV